jgi:hypothetical protein
LAAPADDLEAAVDSVIAACGDARAAVRTLLVANAFLTEELERVSAAVSRGYARNPSARVGTIHAGTQIDVR